MKKTQLHTGMKVGYTGGLMTHPDDGGAFEGLVIEVKRTRAVVESLKRTKRGNGRKWYKKGQRWSLQISALTPLIDASTPTQDEALPPPSETQQEALERILALIEQATSPSEEMVYLRELHRLMRADGTNAAPTHDEFPPHLMREEQALEWARKRKKSRHLTPSEKSDALKRLDHNIQARVDGFTEEELRKISTQLKSACRGDEEFRCDDPAGTLRLIARSGRKHTTDGHAKCKKHMYYSVWGAKYTLGHKNVRGGEPCFRRTTESELYRVAFLILRIGRPLTTGDVENVELSPNSRIDARIKKTCI